MTDAFSSPERQNASLACLKWIGQEKIQAAGAYKRAGLQGSLCAVMGASRDPAHEDESIQRGGVAYLRHCIDAAVTMGATRVAGPLYSAVGRTWQATAEQRKRDLERCARNLKEVARYAEDKGITLAVEPLNRFETSFINLAEQAVVAAVEFENGAIGTLEASRFAAGRKNYEVLEINGEKGSIRFNLERFNELEVFWVGDQPKETQGFHDVLVTEGYHPLRNLFMP